MSRNAIHRVRNAPASCLNPCLIQFWSWATWPTLRAVQKILRAAIRRIGVGQVAHDQDWIRQGFNQLTGALRTR